MNGVTKKHEKNLETANDGGGRGGIVVELRRPDIGNVTIGGGWFGVERRGVEWPLAVVRRPNHVLRDFNSFVTINNTNVKLQKFWPRVL